MPTYDYECLKCGHAFEEFQEITARPRSRCPRCRGRVQRLVTGGAGFLFKGSGWYAVDSRKATPTAAAKSDSPAEGTTGESVKPAAPETPAPKSGKGKRAKE